MPACPNCGRPTLRTRDWACQWCGYPLLSKSYKKIDKTYKEFQEERFTVSGESPPQPAPQPEATVTPPPAPEVQATPKSETKLPPEPAPQPEAVVTPPPEPEVPATPKSETKPPPEPAPQPEAATKPLPPSEPEVKAPPKSESKSPPEPAPAPEATPQPESKTESVLVTPPPVVTPTPQLEPGPPAPEPPLEPTPKPEATVTPPPPEPKVKATAKSESEPSLESEPAPVALPDLDSINDGAALTVDELDALYKENRLAAHARLTDKTIQIRGFVEKVFIRDHIDVRYIVLTGARKKVVWPVRCTFSKENISPMSRLAAGQEVILLGKYDSYGKNIIFKDCVLAG